MANGIIDRALQRRLLEAMRVVYPEWITSPLDDVQAKDPDAVANLSYLQDQGLCEVEVTEILGGPWPKQWDAARITARGIDFLAEDGGLSAALNVVTIRLHPDTIRALLTARIDAEPIPSARKSFLKTHLGRLSDKGLEELEKEVAKSLLQQIPDLVAWLGRFGGL